LIVLDNTNQKNAVIVANTIRKAIEDYRWPHQGIVVTASSGVLEVSVGIELDQLLEEVDRLLYTAKNQGRNCVITNTVTPN
jgi:diguanylate cyclase (GGDEF)-like protein